MIKLLNIKISLLFLLFNLFSQNISAQAGIYSEADIDIQTLFIDAQMEKHKGNLDKQIDILKEIIKRDRGSHAAYYEISKAYLAKEQNDLAQKNAAKSVQIDPNNEWYLLNIAEIYELTNQELKAIQTYDKLLSKDQKNESFYHRKAMNQLKMGEVEKAIETLHSCQNSVGVNTLNTRRLFDLYNQSGQSQQALETLVKLSDKNPNNVRHLLKVALYQKENNLKEDAINTFKKILALEPSHSRANLEINRLDNKNDGTSQDQDFAILDNPNIDISEKIKLLSDKLSISAKSNNTQQIIAASEKLKKSHADNHKVLSLLGDAYFFGGFYKDAESEYEKSIKINDTQYNSWNQWMSSLWELQSIDKLTSTSFNAIDFFPNQPESYFFYIIANKLKNNNEEANEYLEELGFIVGNNDYYKNAYKLIASWFKSSEYEKNELISITKELSEQSFNEAILNECLGDLFNILVDKNNSTKYWKKAILLGANEDRLMKKIGA